MTHPLNSLALHWEAKARPLKGNTSMYLMGYKDGLMEAAEELSRTLWEADDQGPSANGSAIPEDVPLHLQEYLKTMEAGYIEQALKAADYQAERAAIMLGISVATLYRKYGPLRPRAS